MMRANTHVRNLGALLALVFVGGALTGCALLDLLPPLPPDQAPTRVTVSRAQFEDRIQITWEAVERATTYRVFRADAAAGPFQEVGNPATTALDDLEVEEGRLYWYKVRACNTAGCGPESTVVSGYAGHPPAPTNVQASDGTHPDRIVVTWDPVPGATYYQVFRSRDRDVGFDLLLGEPNTPTIADTTATVGRVYWYRVRACITLPVTHTACSDLSEPDSGRR